MAGIRTGKSISAQTIARTLTKQKRLAANFLFSRGRGYLSDTGKFFSTVARDSIGRYFTKAETLQL